MIGPELFPTDIRSFAVPLAGTVSKLLSFTIAKTFLKILDFVGDYLFVSSACVCAVGVTFVFFFVPETQGLSLEEVQGALSNNTRKVRRDTCEADEPVVVLSSRDTRDIPLGSDNPKLSKDDD